MGREDEVDDSGTGADAGTLLRSREQLVVVLLAWVILLIWAAVELPTVPSPAWLLGGASVLIISVVCVRAVRSGVIIRDNEFVVRDVFRSYHLPKDAISEFTIGRWHLFPFCCLVILKDGRRVPATGIQRPNPVLFQRRSRTEWMIDQLNAAVQATSPSEP